MTSTGNPIHRHKSPASGERADGEAGNELFGVAGVHGRALARRETEV